MKPDNNTKPVILIVDDKESNILASENLLEDPGRTILTALSGKEALKIALNRKVDLIMLDVNMPEMDGFEVAQILKSNKKTAGIPIIFATAEKKEHQFLLKGFEEGAFDYLIKPLDPGITRAKVAAFLELQKQRNELMEKNLALEKSGLMINNSADIIGELNASDLTVLEINRSITAILGYDQNEIINQPISTILSTGSDIPSAESWTSRTGPLTFETRALHKSGKIKWLEWKGILKYGVIFFNARDITHQKKTDEEIKRLNEHLKQNVQMLEEMNRELESFTYSVSHDLRAPLRAITGFANMLREDNVDKLDQESHRLIGVIESNIHRMSELIDDLLDLSRIGRKELKLTKVNMTGMVHEVLNETLNGTPVTPEITIGDLPEAKADSSLIRQVWINLISNAIKYSSKKDKATVEIGSKKNKNKVTYFIRDNGVGFDMKYYDKLFGVFQRLHSSKEFEGTGIGLAITTRIVTKHNGQVWAEGKVNEGATFFFSLPLKS